VAVLRFASETAARRFQKRNGRYVIVSEAKWLQIYNGYMQRPFPNGHKCPFGCSGYVSDLDLVSTPRLFYTHFYNQAHRLRLEKLLYLELSRSSNRIFKPILDPGDRFISETAARRFQK
jgi:hypothetical protein